MNLINAEGLTSAPVSVRTYCRSLSISGHLIPAQRRLAVLKRLHGEPGHVVVTRDPRYWALAHPRNLIRVLPEGELPVKDRVTEPDLFALWYFHHLSKAQARNVLAKKKDSAAKDMSGAFATVWQGHETDDLQGLELVGESPQVQEQRFEYHLVDNPLTFVQWTSALLRARETGQVVGIDVEGTSEDDRSAQLVGIGTSVGNQVFYTPLNGPVPAKSILTFLSRVLSGLMDDIKYVAHNAKYDYKMLKRAGLPIDKAELVGDGMICAYVLADVDRLGRPQPKGLKPLVQRYLGVTLMSFDEMLALSGEKDASSVPLKDIGPYCAADAYYGVVIEQTLRAELERRGPRMDIYEKLELPNVLLLAEMELLGLPLDKDECERRVRRYTTNIKLRAANLHVLAQRQGWSRVKVESCRMHTRAKAKIAACSYCGEDGRLPAPVPFNPGSGPMLKELMQQHFQLPVVSFTSKGQASYDEEALLLLREQVRTGPPLTTVESSTEPGTVYVTSPPPDKDVERLRNAAEEFIDLLLVWRGDTKTLGTLTSFVEKAVKHVEV